MSDASDASDAVSAPSTVFSRVAASAAWKRLNRLMPALAAAVILLMGFVLIAATPAGHIPDVWAHTYRIDGIVNGDVLARPVDSTSILHSGSGNVGGCVSRDWIQFSIDHYDGYDPAAVNADFLERYGMGSTTAGSGTNSTSTANTNACVDTPYNNAAVNSPVAYLPQLAAFAIGAASTLTSGTTYVLAEVIMLLVYAGCMFAAVAALPRWRLPMALLLVSPPLIFRYSFAISADSMAQALCLLFACLLFSCMADPRAGNGRLAALMTVGVLMGMSKFTFTPLLLLGFLALIPCHSAARHPLPRLTAPRIAIVAAGNIIGFAFLAAWMKLTGWFTTTPSIVSYEAMTAKKSQLFAEPFSANGLFGAIASIAHAIITGQSNLDSRMQTLVILSLWAVLAMLLIALIAATAKRVFSARMGWFWWCACAGATGIILLTYLALWLQYTPANATGVDGVQFRYFLPLSGIFTLCACECVAGLRRRASHASRASHTTPRSSRAVSESTAVPSAADAARA